MKFITIALALVSFSVQLKWDQTQVDPSARGKYYNSEDIWTAGLTQCDKQCKEKGGNVCGSNQRQCCKEDACVQKLGISVCNEQVSGFKCILEHISPFKLINILPPTAFPQFASLYHKQLAD